MKTPKETIMHSSIAIVHDTYWFSGHFPDNPVLPGIAQLKYVIDLISQQCGTNFQLAGLKRVKFRKIIQPGDMLDIRVTSAGEENQYTFQVTSNKEDVCSGRMSFIPIQ